MMVIISVDLRRTEKGDWKLSFSIALSGWW